jgi:hypothetical protein
MKAPEGGFADLSARILVVENDRDSRRSSGSR